MIYVLNHKSRDPSAMSNKLREGGYRVKVSTDTTDYNKLPRSHPKRYMGLSMNFIKIVTDYDVDDWKIIFHDDLELHPNAVAMIHHILTYAPKAPIGFYNPDNKAIQKAYNSGKHVMRTQYHVWTQCLALPSHFCLPYFHWWKDNVDGGIVSEDMALATYLSVEDIDAFVVMPSMVQHTGYDQSTLGITGEIAGRKRISGSFDKEFSYAAIDWAQQFNDPYANDEKYFAKKGVKFTIK